MLRVELKEKEMTILLYKQIVRKFVLGALKKK